MDLSIQEIKKLSPSRRILLVQEIWDSLQDEPIELTPAMETELDNRLERLDNGEGKSYSLDQAKEFWGKKRQ